MAPTAAYDEIADWYENQFLTATDIDDPIGIRQALSTLLGPPGVPGNHPAATPGGGLCLEIGCGTGAYAAQIRDLGHTPVGVDLSAGMLSYARGRLPVARADATRLPIRDASVGAAVAVMVHTDMPGYPAVVREAARVLRPGGTFVHIGVHPAFCGGFADRTDPAAVVIRPGYLDGHWTRNSWTANGVRDKVGATHWPMPALLRMFLDAGLTFTGFAEGGAPVPTTFAVRAVRSVP